MRASYPELVSGIGSIETLPDLVEDGRTGYVTTWDPADLAGKMELLVSDAARRRAFGENARNRADTEWSFHLQAKAMKSFYNSLMTMGRRA